MAALRWFRGIRRLEDSRGANMVEAAIITPLLVLLTLAIVDFSSMFYVYLALENGVSQAVRYEVTGQQMEDPNNPGNMLSRGDSVKQRMRQATPTLTIPDGAFVFSHMPLGGSSWSGGMGPPNSVQRVQVNYTWTFFTPIMRPFFPTGSIDLSVSSTMKNEGFVE